MDQKQAEQALAKLDERPARNWRERVRKAKAADRLRRYIKPKPLPPWEPPF